MSMSRVAHSYCIQHALASLVLFAPGFVHALQSQCGSYANPTKEQIVRKHETEQQEEDTAMKRLNLTDLKIKPVPIDWYAELAEFHNEAKLVGPYPGGCRCRRLDSRGFTASKLSLIKEPTIFSHVFEGAAQKPWEAWNRTEMLKAHGDVTLGEMDLFHNGAGPYISEKYDTSDPSLAQILDMDQPGNLFLQNAFHEFVPDTTTVFPEHFLSLLNKVHHFPYGATALSFGSKGQWNHIHQHGETIFTQVKGSKGWVFAPPSAFPAEARHMKTQKDNFRQKHLVEFKQADVCGPFRSHGQIRLSGSAQPVASAANVSSAARSLMEHASCCVSREGEALFFPSDWWHGTCDLEQWTAGIAHLTL
eukprot:gnl/TRDRNA2_/TRDRNA2_154701_c0_seq1.p1 gnl/TRDRNA2_/TRDRNA2_154701_c0~~gnl/TRDRNA2_/TRDRNA2_154701_c0_seq1.p1  ORF type:complete len:362 (+),score=45.15 gnl/TRDRNA2_/TRDRNA2_154701_c0_seq1:78-1163(+)